MPPTPERDYSVIFYHTLSTGADQNFLPSDLGTYVPERYVQRVLNILNNPEGATDEAWRAILASLPRLLAPRSGCYITSANAYSCMNSSFLVPMLIIGEKITALSPFADRATEAYHFMLDCQEPCSVFALACLLCSICKLGQRAAHGLPLTIVELSWMMTPVQTFGSIVCRSAFDSQQNALWDLFVNKRRVSIENNEFLAAVTHPRDMHLLEEANLISTLSLIEYVINSTCGELQLMNFSALWVRFEKVIVHLC
ncbi:hypothetical protein JVT61DRAFT_10618 [Boletus reticuloceps]|uniref:Uncharacterized protein n=1 Tax=Boletus reticuloceps TaxID=495285 RepID=A0A8I3A4A2_9AGAM|nr:hypothetical protein JVT61DRAFT_10618 [Boletus reticuloceps]